MNLDAYFARIGFEGRRTPTLETLRALHLAHAQSIAFENLTPLMGQPVLLELPRLEEKLVGSGRGGYCYEQNTLFGAALRELGFQVNGLAARVLWNLPAGMTRPRQHMLLKIDLSGESYLADVGFGGLTLTGPLRLAVDAEQATPHEVFRLVRETDELTMQSFVAGDWKSLYRFDLQPQHPLDYEVSNFYLYTHPASRFRNELVAARPVPGARYGLVNNQLSVHRLGKPSERRVLGSVTEVRDVLQTLFGLTLPPAEALDPAIARACAVPPRKGR
jgi:N-hydroxyarylamine O-acetyltransferase